MQDTQDQSRQEEGMGTGGKGPASVRGSHKCLGPGEGDRVAVVEFAGGVGTVEREGRGKEMHALVWTGG